MSWKTTASQVLLVVILVLLMVVVVVVLLHHRIHQGIIVSMAIFQFKLYARALFANDAN